MMKTMSMLFAWCIVGCSVNESGGAAKGSAGPSVSVAGGKLTVGVWSAKATVEREVAPFLISAIPITVGQYRACVSAGACTAPGWKTSACSKERSRISLDGPTYGDDADASLPVTCVHPVEAVEFCKWAGGGRLPAPDEWLLASRGPNVARFAWGNDEVSCERHWRGQHGAGGWIPCEKKSESRQEAGKSPAGLLDVLSTVGELVGSDPTGFFPACGDAKACMVVSSVPGRIDAVVPVNVQRKEVEANVAVASFRCAWRDAS